MFKRDQITQQAFGVSKVLVVSTQAVSGAGRSPGVRTLGEGPGYVLAE
jgi:aspartate-semialdehyde dehydrogenase